jgi:PEP-CTERM motif
MISRSACFLALGLVVGVADSARADFVAGVDFSSGNLSQPNMPLTVGYAFTVGSTPKGVDALGLEVTSIPPGGTVRLYRDGTTVNLASVTITSANPLSSSTKYRYQTLGTTLNLLANTTYDVVYDLPASTNIFIQASGVTTASGISFTKSVSGNSAGLFPTTDFEAVGPYFGPSPEITAPAVTPEPSSLVLAGVGALGLLAYARRRRKPIHGSRGQGARCPRRTSLWPPQ